MSDALTRRAFAESLVLAALAPPLGIPPGSVASPWPESIAPLRGGRRARLPRQGAGRRDPGPVRRAAQPRRPRHDHPADPGRPRARRPFARSTSPTATSPAFVFSALPPGGDAVSDLSFLTIAELGRHAARARGVGGGAGAHFLDRLERLGPAYNAVVTVLRERRSPRRGERDRELASGKDRGPLHGIPYGAKDLLAAEGAPTTWGAQPYREQMFKDDATVVRRLREAGAVLVRQAGDGRAGRRDGLQPGVRELHRPGTHAVGHVAMVGRVVQRVGRGGRRGAGPVRDRLGDLGIDPVPGGLLRRDRAAADLRQGQPPRRHGPELDDGQAGPARPAPPRTAAWCWPPSRGPTRRIHHALHALSASRRERAAGALPDRHSQGHARQDAAGGAAEFRGFAVDVLRRDGARSWTTSCCPTIPTTPWPTIIDAEAASAFEPLFESGRITELTAPEDRIGGYAGQVVLAKDYLRALRLRRPAGAALHRLLAGVDAIVAPVAPDRGLADRHSVRQGLSRLSGRREHRRRRQRRGRSRPVPPERRRRAWTAHQPAAHRPGPAPRTCCSRSAAHIRREPTHHRLRPPGL